MHRRSCPKIGNRKQLFVNEMRFKHMKTSVALTFCGHIVMPLSSLHIGITGKNYERVSFLQIDILAFLKLNFRLITRHKMAVNQKVEKLLRSQRLPCNFHLVGANETQMRTQDNPLTSNQRKSLELTIALY